MALLLSFVFGMRSQRPAEAVTLSRQNAHQPANRMPYLSDQPWQPVDTSPPGHRSVFLDPHIPQPPPVPSVKLQVHEDGLYILRYKDLVHIPSFDPNADPRTFHLIRRGVSVPILVEGEEDGRFDPGDRILFYGEKRRGSPMYTKYSDEEVYWLTWGGTPGPRVVTEAAPPIQGAPLVTTTQHTSRIEQDVYWYTHHGLDFPTRQTWWWARVQPHGHPITVTFLLTVPSPLPGTSALLEYEVAPRTRIGPHRIRAGVNGRLLAPHEFSAHMYSVFTDTIPVGVIYSSPLSVTIEVDPVPNLQLEDLYINGFSLMYTRTLYAQHDWLNVIMNLSSEANVQLAGFDDLPVHVWDLSGMTRSLVPNVDPDSHVLSVGLLAGKHHLIAASERTLRHPGIEPYTPTELRNVKEGADLIIIAHRNVWEAAEQLADYRRGQGYRVQVVDVETLYNEFGWGWYHPEAIRAFLAYAYTHWPKPAPRYVILFGDGHWNFKGLNTKRYGPLPANLIPPYLAWVDPYQGEVPVDTAYGMVAGNDDIPEMIVGRIAVPNASTGQDVVEKIIVYERGDWWADERSRTLVFVADNPDDAGNYLALVERLVQMYTPSWGRVERIYLDSTYPDEESARGALLNALNQGAWLVLFQGHGAVTRWTHEALFSTDNIPNLVNHSVWPLVVTFNCLDGYFAYPRTDYESIAELMLRQKGAGSIAAWSPAGLGTPWVQDSLAKAFLGVLFTDKSGLLGESIHQARLRFYEDIGPNEIYFTQTLYGDPLLHLIRPEESNLLYLPWTAHSAP